jgi:hypothetical protein
MNEWVKRSIQIANGPEYLDKLQKVYPVSRGPERPLDEDVKERLRQLYEKKNDAELVKELLKMEKFPTKDPYVAFLRHNPSSVDSNPETVRRIADELRAMGFEKMIEGIEQPVEFNRQIGALFKKWLRDLRYPFLAKEQFMQCSGASFLEGGDQRLKQYANDVLRCKLEKAPDFLFRVGDTYVIGEAKFLTDYGGHQDRQFDDALSFVRDKTGEAIRVAVLDGVVWVESEKKMYRQVRSLAEDEFALSALLLKDFLNSLSS